MCLDLLLTIYSFRLFLVVILQLGLNKIKIKRYNIYRSFTYTTLLRLYRTKKVFIRERVYIAFRF